MLSLIWILALTWAVSLLFSFFFLYFLGFVSIYQPLVTPYLISLHLLGYFGCFPSLFLFLIPFVLLVYNISIQFEDLHQWQRGVKSEKAE
ncbi:hypothetical protein QBC38DRAFT_175640 [Podospora fimiseda]|uniref:Uncharacterized protein n=1 Tax=Podospora fimiseda TaxID=252190 RepID=A0AAN7BEB9_9PEZI|nr:hypothetical protein QBC38DRAFT_175640 [Podospora fimiseda]